MLELKRIRKTTSGRFVAPIMNTNLLFPSWLSRRTSSIINRSCVTICCDTEEVSSTDRFLKILSISSKKRMQGLHYIHPHALRTTTSLCKQISNLTFTLSYFLANQITNLRANKVKMSNLGTGTRYRSLSCPRRTI